MNKLSHPPVILVDMDNQLVLLENEKGDGVAFGADRPAANWRLDEHTREVGRRGVAQAREALRQAATRAA